MGPLFITFSDMIKQPITDKELVQHLKDIAEDSREVYLLANGQVRLTVVNTSEMANQMAVNHHTGLLETYILAQAATAGALLSMTVKGDDRLLLQIECGGPIKGLSIESWACGAVRGYLMQNPIILEKPLTSLDTSTLFGPGFLSITKYIAGEKAPFTGTVMLKYGNIAKDLAVYYQESEQTPTLFYISVNIDGKGRLWGSGGIFIQAMPGCDEHILEELQDKAKTLQNLGKAIAKGEKPAEYVMREFAPWKPEHLASGILGFSCPCCHKSYGEYLSRLSQKEQQEMLAGPFPLEIECFNCGTKYSYTKEELEALFSPHEEVSCISEGK